MEIWLKNTWGGGVYVVGGKLNVDRCVIINNNALNNGQGGGLNIKNTSQATISNCVIANNLSSGFNEGHDTGGGGIYSNNCTLEINNTVFYGNRIDGSIPEMTQSYGAAIWGNANIRNSIIWGNYCDNEAGCTQIYGDISINYSDVQGGYAGIGNIDLDPLFVSSEDENFRLTMDSPCIDAGDPASDYSEEPEPNGMRINMGAYGGTSEAATSELPDSDGDGLSDTLENAGCTDTFDADTDDDGISDGVEDANQNGVVDAGETDPCNIDTDNDGVQDGTELGYTLDDIGADTDTGVFVPDLDSSTTTDALASDTDDDGIDDGVEDSNHNGRQDPGETDPDESDSDGDGVPDAIDNCPVLSNADQADEDEDGIGDACEFLKAYYPFDNSATDESGNGNDGVLHGDANFTTDRFDNPDSALQLDGIDDYVDIGTGTFDLSAELTVAMWIRRDPGSSNYQAIIQKGTYVRPFLIRFDKYNKIQICIRTDTTNYLTTDTALDPGVWYHVALTYGSGSITIYINGQDAISASASGDLAVLETETYFGSRQDGNYPFTGAVDDARIYNRALTSDEVLELYNEQPPSATWYVDNESSCTQNCGTEWVTAFNNIQSAVDNAIAGDDIWVKEGTYALSAQIDVNKAVNIYGGFPASISAPIMDDRDPDAFISKFDGQNSVSCFHINSDATLDGLTVVNGDGNHNGSLGRWSGGGAVYIGGCSAVITNCRFIENHNGYGGGIIADGGNTIIRNCYFRGNTGGWGGSICDFYGVEKIEGCTFENNTGGDGSGVNIYANIPLITGCSFINNNGSAVNMAEDSGVTVRGCIFRGNIGGAIRDSDGDGAVNITNSLFSNNSTSSNGGAIRLSYPESLAIANCTFTNNHASTGGAVSISGDGAVDFVNNILWGNNDSNGYPEIYTDFYGPDVKNISFNNIDQEGFEGNSNIRQNPLFVDPDNGDYHLQLASPCIDAGDPASDYSDEPEPNGMRINMGAYGGTSEAATSELPDSDGDGLSDTLENEGCTNSNDADTDDDGIADGVEDVNQNGAVDAGETDPCNIDTDNDGIQDGTELGYTLDDIGADTDTGLFVADLDSSTTTDALNNDSDADGLDDGVEDSNHNGRHDLPGETDPADSDSDGDGVSDAIDNCAVLSNADQADNDRDGIGNVCDTCPNICNTEQLDADNDGTGDVCDETPGCGGCGQDICEQECVIDTDGDGILDPDDNCPVNCNSEQLDADSDGEGDVCDDTPGCGGCGADLCEQECFTCDDVDRFLDNGDGTVTDCRTDLIWLKNANCNGALLDWTGAGWAAAVLTDGGCGLSDGSVEGDWRLPTVEELQAIGTNPPATWASSNPADYGIVWTTPGSPFVEVMLMDYWASDEYGGDYVGGVNMTIGFTYVNNSKEYDAYYVWPVRSDN